MPVTVAASTFTVLPGGKAPQTEEERMRENARALVARIDTGFMELGKLIYLIFTARKDPSLPALWVEWGYKDWDDYCARELAMSGRKADYLKSIYHKLEVDLVGVRAEVRAAFYALGWNKCRLLIRVITERNILEWLEKGRDATGVQLELMVQDYSKELAAYKERQERAGWDTIENDPAAKEKRQLSESAADNFDPPEELTPRLDEAPPKIPEVVDLVKKVFMLHGEQEKVLDSALRRAGVATGSSKDSERLTVICEEYLANADMLRGARAKVEILTRLARIMNVRVAIVEPETMDVIHGMDLVVDIARRQVASAAEN